MNEVTHTGLFNRTFQNIREVWRDLAGKTSGIFSTYPSPELPDREMEMLREQMRDCLKARGGEVSARMRAATLGRTYLDLNSDGRRRFLEVLARDFDVDRAQVDKAAAALQEPDLDLAERIRAEQKLQRILEPPRLKLLMQFNGLPEGIRFLVDLRSELIHLRQQDPALAALEGDLKGLLMSWFDVGFLELQRITWDSPASLLEKLIAYEAVHAIRSWEDLKNRLGSDRRCFGFFHPRMPNEPLIFVQVALVAGMSGNVQALLDESAPPQDPAAADTAIFYSISNAQPGLAGISFGDFLIKRVVDVLAAEFRNLKTFATLSPIPGFRAWLDSYLAQQDAATIETEWFMSAERKALGTLPLDSTQPDPIHALLAQPDWHLKPEYERLLKAPLTRLCAHYLAEEKKNNGMARNRVAHFHLSNGARIERLNWLANTSTAGLAESAGMMVNYLYKLDDIEANHEAYKGEGQVKTSSSIRALLRSQRQLAAHKV